MADLGRSVSAPTPDDLEEKLQRTKELVRELLFCCLQHRSLYNCRFATLPVPAEPRAIEILLSLCAEKSCADGFTADGPYQEAHFHLVQLEMEQRRSSAYVEELKRLRDHDLAKQKEVWLLRQLMLVDSLQLCSSLPKAL